MIYSSSSLRFSSNFSTIPLLLSHSPGTRVAWWGKQSIDRETFLAHVSRVASNLPRRSFAINLCEDRYLFTVTFAAVISQGQTNLLPASRVKGDIQEVSENYPDSYRVLDQDVKTWITTGYREKIPVVLAIPCDQVAAIAFTSGSTGRARPHPKHWGGLVEGAWLAQRRFGFGKELGTTIVATVPPQHMYGLETSVMVPLVTGVNVHSSKPLFPEDIRATLATLPEPRILITTPAHLRICIRADFRWSSIAFIISATAPLSGALAAAAEQCLGAPVLEIYGCTEAGSIASRHTVSSELWRLYDGMKLSAGCVYGTHLNEPVTLNDIIEEYGKEEFKLLGRREDVVNIAGKRTSLSYLNYKLTEISGVEDGVFFLPDNPPEGPIRLLALVVAPVLSERDILTALADRIDSAFLPRPLYKIESLPRKDTGKLSRMELLALLRALSRASNS